MLHVTLSHIKEVGPKSINKMRPSNEIVCYCSRLEINQHGNAILFCSSFYMKYIKYNLLKVAS